MDFVIQVGNPTVITPRRAEAADLAEALQLIFPLATEAAYLTWSDVPVRLDYKYDLSVMVDDLPRLLDPLLTTPSGSQTVHFGSDTFNVAWAINWQDDDLSIEATRHSAHGSYEDLLNSRAAIELERTAFLREWKALLERILAAFDASGVRVANTACLDAIRRIADVLEAPGVLYEQHT